MMRSVLLLSAALCASVAFARVEPSALFTDHAVLLRAADTPVFGFAAPGEKVTVTLGATSASAVADAKGAWLVRLDLREAPKTPQTLTMNEARAEDVLVGAVWLCSGQSNMSFTLASADDAEAENRLSNAEIRCFHVDTRYELKPNPRIAGRWLRDRPQEKLGFSAIGYHFAKRLQAELGAPVGIVNSSVGASTIEAWCDAAAMAAFPEGKRRLDGQIAFMANYRDYERTCQAALRAAQQRTLALPQTGQVILVDAGEQGDIHPRDKRTPGRRLADWALNRVYGRTEVPCRGPYQAGVAFADGKAAVRFAGCVGELVARDLGETYVIRLKSNTRGKVKRNSPAAEVEGFALAGADGVWHWADAATIRGETVEVSAKAVPQPVAVRYGWSKNPWVNLYNGANLPAEPFEVSATDVHDARR